jgi:hypothetical protein
VTSASFYLQPNQDKEILNTAPPWGKETMVLDFCGGPYRFEGLSKPQVLALKKRYESYLLPRETRSRIITQVRQIPEDCFRSFDPQGWIYERMEYQYEKQHVHVAGLQMLARITLADHPGGYLGTSLNQHEWFPGLVFENYFRLLTAYRLLTLGGVMLHSAGIESEGKANLFLGHSGSGKSTLSEMARDRGLRVLSDDLNVLLPVKDRIMVEKVPFTGTFAQIPDERRRFDLGAIFRLTQGTENALGTLGPGEALTLLLSCSPFVNEDPFRFESLGDNLIRILQQATTRNLVFNREGGCFDLF